MRHRKNRIQTIRDFLDSGQQVIIVEVDPGYRPQAVAYALQTSIRRNPWLNSRCEAFLHNGRVFLARK